MQLLLYVILATDANTISVTKCHADQYLSIATSICLFVCFQERCKLKISHLVC